MDFSTGHQVDTCRILQVGQDPQSHRVQPAPQIRCSYGSLLRAMSS